MKRLIPYFLSFSIHLLVLAFLVILLKTNDKHHSTADKPIIVDVVTAADRDKDTIVSRNAVKNLKKVSTQNRVSTGPLTAKKRYKIVQPKGYDISRRNTRKKSSNLLNSKIRHTAALQKNIPQIYVRKRKKSKRAGTIHVASINHNSILNTSAKHQLRDNKPLYSAATAAKGIKTGSGSFKREAAVSIATKDYRYASYMAHIKRQVESVWIYPEEAIEKGESGVLFLFFVINRNGSLKNIKLINSSGHKILDDAAINALKDAAPFPALPKRLNIDRLKVYASFRYNISFDTNIN